MTALFASGRIAKALKDGDQSPESPMICLIGPISTRKRLAVYLLKTTDRSQNKKHNWSIVSLLLGTTFCNCVIKINQTIFMNRFHGTLMSVLGWDTVPVPVPELADPREGVQGSAELLGGNFTTTFLWTSQHWEIRITGIP